MDPTRRALMRHFGGAAALLWAGCVPGAARRGSGGAPVPSSDAETGAGAPSELAWPEVEEHLHAAISAMRGRFERAHARAIQHRRDVVVRDGAGIARGSAVRTGFMLRGTTGETDVTYSAESWSPAALWAGLAAIGATGPRGGWRPPAVQGRFRSALARTPDGSRDWSELARAPSNVVVRAVIDQADQLDALDVHIDASYRSSSADWRRDVVAGTWGGGEPRTSTATQWGPHPDRAATPAVDVDGLLRRARELPTPHRPLPRVGELVLTAGAVAPLLRAIVDGGLLGARERRAQPPPWLVAGLARARWTLTAHPAQAPYGRRTIDDDGVPIVTQALVADGLIASGLLATASSTQRLRAAVVRQGAIGARVATVPHLALAGGDVDEAQLIADLDDGFVVEGPARAWVDFERGGFALMADRARAIVHGAPTGHVYFDVEVVGQLGEWLPSIRALGRAHGGFGERHGDNAPWFVSTEAPPVRCRGELRFPAVPA